MSNAYIALTNGEEELLAENVFIYIVKPPYNAEWQWTFLDISGVIWIIQEVICKRIYMEWDPTFLG